MMFWRLLIAYGILLVATVGLLGHVLERRAERRELEQIEESLQRRALLAREVVRDVPAGRLQRRAAEVAGQDELGLRITLFDGKGKVLADSEDDPVELEDHGPPPEVLAAAEQRFGTAVRRSHSPSEKLMYVALRADLSGSPVGYVRVALPLDRVKVQLAELRKLIFTTAGVAAALALALTVFLSRRLARPIQEVTQAAEHIAAGSYGQKVYTPGRGAIARLARTFNHMSACLAGQINQLEEDQQQLRAILSGMVEGVVALDAEQRILFANERAAHLLDFAVAGYTTAGVVGRKLWDVVRQRALLDLVQDALTRPGPQREEMNWNGLASRTLTVHAARLAGDPPRGAVLVIHDTSELRRLERLRQEFVANVSHELKTPLTVIKACVETLLEGGAAEDPRHCRAFLEKVADQSERLHRLILDLLSLARIESGTETFVFQSVAVPEVAGECLERHRARAEAKGQTLEAIPCSRLLSAWVDEEALGEILDNLIDNAVKYTPTGGTIQLHWWGEDEWACLEVRDNGMGIPAHDLPRVFERFYRADKARSRELGGTGLGLSIVKHLVQAMRGSITVTSQVGQGTSFVVRLPRTGERQPPERSKTQGADGPCSGG